VLDTVAQSTMKTRKRAAKIRTREDKGERDSEKERKRQNKRERQREEEVEQGNGRTSYMCTHTCKCTQIHA